MGRAFNLTVDFPAGFQVEPGQKIEVTANSNHPNFPRITVPVVWLQMAAPPQARGVPD